LQLVKDVQSPWFGINFDSGNFQGNSDTSTVYADMARMAPYALNAQIKVMIALQGRNKVPTDFKRIAQILRDSGYRGYIVLEYEENEPVQEACRRYLAELREAFLV
jgi:sugar phosphate isomerase/epimerase